MSEIEQLNAVSDYDIKTIIHLSQQRLFAVILPNKFDLI